MRKGYKISLTIVGFLLCFSILLEISYLKYLKDEKIDSSLVMVEDGLSVNYTNGNHIQTEGNTESIDFSVTNNSEETLYYYIQATNVNCNKEDIKYTLTEKSNILNVADTEFPLTENYLASFIEIKPRDTHSYHLTILENLRTFLNADIKIGLEDDQEETFASTLLKNNKAKKEPMTKLGEVAATTDEGLIESSDDIGISYYFRGSVANNYVKFANLMWRIVKINGDGSIKLILNDYISETANYYGTDNPNSLEDKLDFTNTNINTVLQNWYQTNLNGYEKYISTSKYCIDDSVGQTENNNVYYLGFSRLLTDYNPAYNCLGNKYNERIALLTADEAVFAGATKNMANTEYYLYNAGKDKSWWTMTPASNNGTDINYFEIDNTGTLKNDSAGSYYRGIKPVINIVKKSYTTGKGTLEDPYLIKE